MDFKCKRCNTKFSETKKIIAHLKSVYGLKDNKENIECIVDNEKCKKSYHTFDSLSRHAKICLQAKIEVSLILVRKMQININIE